MRDGKLIRRKIEKTKLFQLPPDKIKKLDFFVACLLLLVGLCGLALLIVVGVQAPLEVVRDSRLYIFGLVYQNTREPPSPLESTGSTAPEPVSGTVSTNHL